MEIDKFLDKLSNTLLQKLLNETEKINQKIDNLESKVEEQKIQFGKTFSTLNNQVALISENTRKINKQISSQNEAKTEIKNVEIDLSSLKINESSLDYINSHLEYKLVAQFGLTNETIFVIAAKVNGKIYYGLDSSKKKARNNAAEKVFQDLKNQFNKVSVNPENKEIKNATAYTEININVLSSNEKLLEYLKKNLVYSLVETVGPADKPTFKMAVKVNGKIYHGFGTSKEKAKINTAENVFESLKNQFKDDLVISNNDFVNIEINPNLLVSKQNPFEYVRSVLTYRPVETMVPKNKRTFKMAVKVNGKVYFGEGNTKTKARCAVAEEVFKDLVINPYSDKTNSRQNQQKGGTVGDSKQIATEEVLESITNNEVLQSIRNNFPQPRNYLNKLYPNVVCPKVDEKFEDEEADETVFEEKDIEFIMLKTNASRTRAIEALKKSENNTNNAILKLTSR